MRRQTCGKIFFDSVIMPKVENSQLFKEKSIDKEKLTKSLVKKNVYMICKEQKIDLLEEISGI